MMSEITRTAIQAPIAVAMASEMSRSQFHTVAQDLLRDFDRVTAENAALQQRLNAADQKVDEPERDKARLNALESNFWVVRYTTSPNGDAGDYSNGIEIVGYWMDAPVERVIGENYNENLRAAIDQAMSAPAYPPARPEYPEPEPGEDDWHMNPCKQGHRDVGASSGVAACNQCNEKIEAATTQEAFDQWNASHPPASEKPVQPFTEQFIEDHLGKMPDQFRDHTKMIAARKPEPDFSLIGIAHTPPAEYDEP